jgi:F0F1-type ATP synthase assembly protein I
MIGLVGTMVFGVLFGGVGALSFGAGAVCVVIPSAYFAWTSQQTMEPGRIVGQGVVKVLSTGVLIALVLVSGPVEPVGFFLGLLAGQSAYWWALLERPDYKERQGSK